MELYRPGKLHPDEGLIETLIKQIPAQNVLDDMSVEEERAELILKKAESHETTYVPERV